MQEGDVWRLSRKVLTLGGEKQLKEVNSFLLMII